jgi:hypothetical protein
MSVRVEKSGPVTTVILERPAPLLEHLLRAWREAKGHM